MDVRAEYEEFFQAAYPWLVSQLHAITGDRVSARAAVESAFDGCWQRWSVVRRLTDPLTWVRWTALRAAVQNRGGSVVRRRSAPAQIPTDTDEGVVLAALQRLPWSQRQAVVLHYMGDVTVEELARRSGTTADAVDWLLDTGFDTLVETLGWPVGDTDEDADPRWDWTAEALGDTAMLLAADVTVPDPSSVLQRAAVLRWAKRTAPIAVSAACVSSIVVLAAQLSPAGTAVPRTPTIYVAEPSAGDGGGGYTQVRVPPVVDGRGGPGGVAAPVRYLGIAIQPVSQSTALEDFGVSAPPPADAAARAEAEASGPSVSRAGATTGETSTAGGTPTESPATGGGQTTTAPGSGSSGGGAPSTSTNPATIPPTTSPVTIPPTTPGATPPTTTPATTTPPTTTTTTTPPTTSTTTPPPPVTTDPPVVTTTTTEPPVITTTTEPPVITTTIQPPVITTTTAPPVITTTTEAALTTTLAAETTTVLITTTVPTTTTAPTTTVAEETTSSGG